MSENQVEGLVVKKYSGFYYVGESNHIYECRLRGKLRERVLTGDRVRITPLEPGKGVVEEVLPRRTRLYRPPIANVNLVLIVLARNNPAPSLILLDRLLVLASCFGVEPCIVMNKFDLEPASTAQSLMEYYPRSGYQLVATSALDGQGIEELTQVVKGNVAVLAGPSGVGKSSILNAMLPGQALSTQDISRIGRGKHTTRHVELFSLGERGWLADTPGFSVLELPRIKRQELDKHFAEFEKPAQSCRFADCLHWKEQSCGVKEAVDKGVIAGFRYQNYLTLLAEVIEDERCY